MSMQVLRQLVHLTVLCGIAFFAGAAPARGQAGDPVLGQKVFKALGCVNCHTVRGEGGPGGVSASPTETKAPDLGVSPEGTPFFGSTVELGDGQKVLVDEKYILESITNPDVKVVKDLSTGRPYPAGKMPPRFKNLPENQLAGLVAYIKDGLPETVADVTTTDETAPAETAVWVWVLLGCCGCAVASVNVACMSRHISWGWIAMIVMIPALGTAAGVGWASWPTDHHSEIKVDIKARQFAYDPPIIGGGYNGLRVNKGDTVTLTLQSEDVYHGFYLDGYGIDEDILPGRPVQVTFVADKAGRFSYRCSHTCGVFHPFMIGNLIVEPNYLFPGSLGLCFGLGLATFVYVAKKEE